MFLAYSNTFPSQLKNIKKESYMIYYNMLFSEIIAEKNIRSIKITQTNNFFTFVDFNCVTVKTINIKL